MTKAEEILLETIAASDDPDGEWELAIYSRGDVDDDDESEAWLKRAAELGIVAAMADYADFLEESQRHDEAEAWYRAAAAAGSPRRCIRAR